DFYFARRVPPSQARRAGAGEADGASKAAKAVAGVVPASKPTALNGIYHWRRERDDAEKIEMALAEGEVAMFSEPHSRLTWEVNPTPAHNLTGEKMTIVDFYKGHAVFEVCDPAVQNALSIGVVAMDDQFVAHESLRARKEPAKLRYLSASWLSETGDGRRSSRRGSRSYAGSQTRAKRAAEPHRTRRFCCSTTVHPLSELWSRVCRDGGGGKSIVRSRLQ
ncbi:unnamed protein product, partial [Amoebophrya sp. A25]